MQQALQWNKLESRANDSIPPNEGWRKAFTLSDHLIVLTQSSHVVYTFHLKELSWSKHYITLKSNYPMNFSPCLVKDGLILDRNPPSVCLQYLTFELKKAPTSFCLSEKRANISVPTKMISDGQGSVYLAHTQGPPNQLQKPTYVYKVNLENAIVTRFEVQGTIPYLKDDFSAFLENGRLFFVERGEFHSLLTPELWIFHISKEKWEQLSNKSFPDSSMLSSEILVQEDQIFIFGNSFKGTSVISRRLSEDSWKTLVSSPDPKNNVERKAITLYQESIILVDGSEVYSLDVSAKTKKPKSKELEKLMEKLYTNNTFTDVKFQVENEEFRANKCDMMESHEKIIPVKNVRAKVFKVLLQYVYLQEYVINKEIARDLFKLSHEYMIDELQAACEKFLSRNIQIENVIQMIKLAQTYQAHQLREACITLIGQNFDEVFKNPDDIRELESESLILLYKNKK